MDLDYEKLLESAREGLEDVMQNAERFSPPKPEILHEGSKKTIIRNGAIAFNSSWRTR